MDTKLVVIIGLLGVAFFAGGTGVALHDSYDQGATAAVSLAGGVMSPSDDVPAPDDEKKYPRKDCPYCNGTGKIEQGDGHETDCTHCYVKDLFEGKKKCCPHCDCGDNCKCTYPGECLVNANGGKPVKICDERGCGFYAKPEYEFVEQPAPPFVDPEALGEVNRLKGIATEKYRAKDYLSSLLNVEQMDKLLTTLPLSPEVDVLRKEINKARRNIGKFVGPVDRAVYKKFAEEYAVFIEKNKKEKEQLRKVLEESSQVLSSGDSCSGNSCSMSSGSSCSMGDGSCGSGNGSSCGSGGSRGGFRFFRGFNGGGCTSCGN